MSPRTGASASLALLALLTLSACGSNQAQTPSATETVTITVVPSDSAVPSASPVASDSQSPAASTAASQASNAASPVPFTNDDVRAALERIQQQYPQGKVLDFDAEQQGNFFDFSVLDGETQHEVRIDRAGQLNLQESDFERDNEDLTRAQAAQVSALDALNKALEGRDGLVVSSFELEQVNGQAVWSFELDDATGRETARLEVNAVDGSLIQR